MKILRHFFRKTVDYTVDYSAPSKVEKGFHDGGFWQDNAAVSKEQIRDDGCWTGKMYTTYCEVGEMK